MFVTFFKYNMYLSLNASCQCIGTIGFKPPMHKLTNQPFNF